MAGWLLTELSKYLYSKPKVNLLFAGQIGSGKTLVSKAVANSLSFRWNSFGATLKNIAFERGLPVTREDLQALGEKMVVTEADELCSRALADAKPAGAQSIVIDGLRHQHIRDILQRLSAPQPLRLIYVDVRDSIRCERIEIRDRLTATQIQKLDEHSTEAQVADEIRSAADFIADNSGLLEATVSQILAYVWTFRN